MFWKLEVQKNDVIVENTQANRNIIRLTTELATKNQSVTYIYTTQCIMMAIRYYYYDESRCRRDIPLFGSIYHVISILMESKTAIHHLNMTQSGSARQWNPQAPGPGSGVTALTAG